MPQLTQNLIRLDASSYHGEDFFQKELLIAKDWGLRYFNGLKDFLSLSEEVSANTFYFISNTHSSPKSIPAEILERTKLWIHSNSGYDNFNSKFIESVSFPIVTGNPIRSSAVTEYILAHLFERFSLISHQPQWDRTRAWPRELLSQKNILICGNGIIGKGLTAALKPLASEVFQYDPHLFKEQSFDLKSHLTTLPKIDIVLLACSLNSTSRHLINSEVIELLSDNFFLINAARGGLVNESALLSTLGKKESAAATLDVFEIEPTLSNYPDLKNLKRTSHIAGVSKSLDQLILNFESEVLASFFNDSTNFSKTYENLFLSNRIDHKNKELI